MATKAMFGWCIENQHRLCRKKVQRWYHGKVKRGRKMVDEIVWLDEYNECSCMCHKRG